MTSVYCVFQKVKINKEEWDLLISIHETQIKAQKQVDKLNAEKKHFYFWQIWNVQ